jgi:hypothetical protein
MCGIDSCIIKAICDNDPCTVICDAKGDEPPCPWGRRACNNSEPFRLRVWTHFSLSRKPNRIYLGYSRLRELRLLCCLVTCFLNKILSIWNQTRSCDRFLNEMCGLKWRINDVANSQRFNKETRRKAKLIFSYYCIDMRCRSVRKQKNRTEITLKARRLSAASELRQKLETRNGNIVRCDLRYELFWCTGLNSSDLKICLNQSTLVKDATMNSRGNQEQQYNFCNMWALETYIH